MKRVNLALIGKFAVISGSSGPHPGSSNIAQLLQQIADNLCMSDGVGKYVEVYPRYKSVSPPERKTRKRNNKSLLDRASDHLYDAVLTDTAAFVAGAAISGAYSIQQASTHYAIAKGMRNQFAARIIKLKVPMGVINKLLVSTKAGAVGGAFVAGFCLGTLANKSFTWLNDGVTLGEQLYIWRHADEPH